MAADAYRSKNPATSGTTGLNCAPLALIAIRIITKFVFFCEAALRFGSRQQDPNLSLVRGYC